VVVEDKPLATLLGDAENPSHTQWQKECSNYKDKYTFGPSNLEFVSDSVAQIVRLATETEQEADPAVLVDLFSIPAEPQTPDTLKSQKKKATPKDGEEPPGPPEPPTAKPRSFRVQMIEGGFRIVPGGDGAQMPDLLDIKVAYDVRRGNPLKKYDKADFELVKSPIKLGESDGVELVNSGLNHLVVKVLQPKFSLSVTGFDKNRDLVVKVLSGKEETDDDQTA
jgi:hypothetical protein